MRVMGSGSLGALAFAFAIFQAPSALAFDTGHHFDLTREVLMEEGFGEPAIQLSQASNWLCDYYSTAISPDPELSKTLSHLHADNLLDTTAVAAYWPALAIATRRALARAVEAQDVRGTLALMAISTHTVQDFYGHSNWVDRHPRRRDEPYRTETWFSPSDRPEEGLLSGWYPLPLVGAIMPHGNYTSGLNRDSYIRPGWDEAYVFAYAATREWTGALHAWTETLRPGFWARCRDFAPDPTEAKGLALDVRAAYELSKWATPGPLGDLAMVRRWFPSGAEGHWKGNGSASLAHTAMTAAAPWTEARSPAVKGFKAWPGLIAPDLAMAEAGVPTTWTVPPIPPLVIDRRAVIVRTVGVEEAPKPPGFGLDTLSPPDFFARITVAGLAFVEATRQDESAFTPPWTTIRFVPRALAQVPIQFALIDEDGPDADDPVHFTGDGQAELDLVFTVLGHGLAGPSDGTVGVHDVEPLTSRGRDATVRLTVSERLLAERGN